MGRPERARPPGAVGTDLGSGSGQVGVVASESCGPDAQPACQLPSGSRYSPLRHHLLPARWRMMAEEEDFESRQFLLLDLICSRPRRLPLPPRAWPLGYGSAVPPRGTPRSATANYHSHDASLPESPACFLFALPFRLLALSPRDHRAAFSQEGQGDYSSLDALRPTVPALPERCTYT